MNSKKIILIIGLVILVSLAGCFLSWQRYSNEEYGFSILFPRMWQKEEGVAGTVILVTSPQKGSSDKYRENINVMAADLSEEVSLATFFELNKDEAMRVLPGVEYNISEGEIFAGGISGKWLSFNTRMEGLTLRIISASWMKGTRVYVVSCSAEYEKYPKYEPIFKKVMHSLRIK
ncbi:MAG: hypothetical protein ISS45_02335 [Candidatus Omnitrophica bacterium]|nr:hypothetical protein [Candidatus Omnitrophota bacterium]